MILFLPLVLPNLRFYLKKSRLKIRYKKEIDVWEKVIKFYDEIGKNRKMSGNCGKHMIYKGLLFKTAYRKKHSSKIKIVTGLRKTGKSYLLGVIFK